MKSAIMQNSIRDGDMEEEQKKLVDVIEELLVLQKRADAVPWYCTKEYEGTYGETYCDVGDYELEEGADSYYEDTIANFWGGDKKAIANAQYAIAAVTAVPLLIARIIELEQKTSTGLSDDIEAALKSLDKWRKTPAE